MIVITGHGDVPLAVEAMKFGALDFLEEPFDDELLLASVRSALNNARRNATKSRVGWPRCRTASATYSRGWSAGKPTSRLPTSDLGISPRTIEIYRANLMTKMQAASLSNLVHVTHRQDSRSRTPSDRRPRQFCQEGVEYEASIQ